MNKPNKSLARDSSLRSFAPQFSRQVYIRMIRSVVVTNFLLLSFVSNSGDVRYGFSIGHGNIGLKSSVDLVSNSTGDGALSRLLYLGYAHDNKIIFDISKSSATDDVLLGASDNVLLETVDISFGYLYERGSIYIEPKIGFTYWDLRIREGALLNTGPIGNLEDDGEDSSFMLTAGFRLTETAGVSLSYKAFNFDYGQFRHVYLGYDATF